MLVATLVAAAVLGQACPEPPSRYGPPPCAAANVPGCLPGYHREVDAQGRSRYVCDAANPPPVAPQAAPAPPVYEPRYQPSYAAPWVAPPERLRLIGIVLMPGVSSNPSGIRDRGEAAGAIALELHPSWGGARLRLGLEGGKFGRVAEVALKYDFNEGHEVRPFLAVSAGGGAIDPDPVWRFEGSIAGGVDLYLSREFFFTLELKERWFADRAAGTAYGLEPTGLHQTAFFAGVGLYL